MTIHSSLKLKNTLGRARNVFKRIERLEILERDGKRTEGDSVFNLPKVRTRFKIAGKKKEKKPSEEEAAAEQGEASEGGG